MRILTGFVVAVFIIFECSTNIHLSPPLYQLYYLGDTHLGAFERNLNNPTQKEWDHLAKAVEYFIKRTKASGGNREETWWTNLKV